MLFLAIYLTACGNQVHKPVNELSSAEAAISEATYHDAASYALTDLDRANSKLAAAYADYKMENYNSATRLASEARVDANLALAKAEATKSIEAAKSMKITVELLEKNLRKARQRY